ncbi:hypothetical protein E4V01_25120 [Methylorubrum sp. Q1]|uniref:Imm8 family immunity protein n=1 Tax=Methylorubrum sp. Q1 TaxID=2562453 RepID=UPI0010761A9D|nr:Imm8 family immunity protein [Methylorubrum sp. Q1]TFZ54494.1 hypothetical protein E4V01_25120 [Methylorubrum sp. Q1]
MKLVIPELKRIHSPDKDIIEFEEEFKNDPYCILIQAMYGIHGQEGDESFDILVCNPSWIELEANNGIFSGRHYLITTRFDIDVIKKFLIDIALNCAASSWQEAAERLGRYGKWEFEDYIE